MKRFGKKSVQVSLACLCAIVMLTGCGNVEAEKVDVGNAVSKENAAPKKFEGVTEIILSDEGTTVDGAAVSEDTSAAVYAAKDIVFYLADQGFTYGEGTEADEHTQEEADQHTVIHITKPGTYAVSGSLSAGQIAVDLGDGAKKDSEAVVTLILNNMDITCTVAPAVIFYNVYECEDDDAKDADRDVDTTRAGANVLIADGTYNTVNGSYVARIYESYELSEDGKEVVDNEKLHKYDGAFYSKRSMNINGDEEGTGVLEINAENEGLNSELHLTINGGNIKIASGNDGINTNEDEVSVTTVNGGTLAITVKGTTGEGDGIDSNGWLVINGGNVFAYACSTSADAGIDSDMGIHINGGTVLATGNMLDTIAESEQNYAVFSFSSRQKGGENVVLKDEKNNVAGEWSTGNDYSYMIIAGDMLTEGTYTLWIGDKQLAGSAGGMGMGFGGNPGMGGGMGAGPGFAGGERPEMPEGAQGGERPEMPEGAQGGERPQMPEGAQGGERPEMPGGAQGGEMPAGNFSDGGMKPGGGRGQMQGTGELSDEFTINAGGNYFNFISEAE